jgi:hypothetical protein
VNISAGAQSRRLKSSGARVLLTGIVFAACAAARAPSLGAQPAWPDSFVSRLEALALIQTLHGETRSRTNAPATLETWCRDHKLAPAPKIVARVNRGEAPPATAEQRRRLQVGDDERVIARSVELRCGDVVLSRARNWYVPGRLTADMNRLLETTDTPFGAVIQRLQPYRQTIGVRMLWQPLPQGWESGGGGGSAGPPAAALAIPDALFEHRAIVYTGDRKALSEVDEVYQRGVLAFAVTAPAR